MESVILHIDMNNFYASVECMKNPTLKNSCVAVCGSTDERHGIVLAKNYGAKNHGVVTGETIWQAKKKCPSLIVVPPNYDDYVKFSKRARAIYSRYTDHIEPYGMDECWLDVTKSQLFGSGYQIAEKIRHSIKFELGLTVSIGVSFNKIFSKLGSDMKKPDAITCIYPDSFREKVWPLEASNLLGVGRATKKILDLYGIKTIGNIAHASESFLKSKLGINGIKLKQYANGVDTSLVTHNDVTFPIKSVGHGITTIQDLENPGEVWYVMLELVQDIANRLRLYAKKAQGVSVSIKNNQLYTRQWQCKLDFPSQSASLIAQKAFDLFQKNYDWEHDVRAVSVCAISIVEKNIPIQHDLFTDVVRIKKQEKLDAATALIRERFGKHSIRNAVLLQNKKIPQHTECLITMPTGMLK